MKVPFVLILIHASVGTVVKFDFIPPKSYELEVNQTRTNLKLKVGRNGDGHIIENILKPLFVGSGQVGIEESDKNCTKKTCKKKCVKRKKVCLKGDLDTLLRKSKKKNGAINIRISKAKKRGHRAKNARNESAAVRFVTIHNGELIVSTAKKKYQEPDDKMKGKLKSPHRNVGEGDLLQTRLSNARNKGRHLGGKDSKNKEHASLKKRKERKHRNEKMNLRANKSNGIFKENTYQKRKRSGKQRKYDLVDKYNIVKQTNVGFGQIIPVTPNSLLSMHILPQNPRPWWLYKTKIQGRNVSNERKYQRHGRMIDYLLPYYSFRDFSGENADPSPSLSNDLAKQYKVVMTTHIKIRPIPLNVNDTVVKLAGTQSDGQKQKHVEGELKLDNKSEPLASNTSRRKGSSHRKGYPANYDDIDDNGDIGSIDIYEEITDDCGRNIDVNFDSTFRCMDLTYHHVMKNFHVYHAVENMNVLIYLTGERGINSYIYAHYHHNTITTPNELTQTLTPNITGSEVTESTTKSATIITESVSADAITTMSAAESVTEPIGSEDTATDVIDITGSKYTGSTTTTNLTESLTEIENTATIASNANIITIITTGLVSQFGTIQSGNTATNIADITESKSTDLVTTTSVTESITELESTTTVKNNTIENPADLTTTKVTVKPTTQSKGLTNTTANIPDTEPASHDTATTVAESISASIESQHTAANITDITESKSTDLVTTTSVTESITELESTTTVKNNTIENPADLTTTKVTVKPTTQSKGLTNTTANIPDTEPASHDTATTVAESISASIESQHTAANITDITESKSTDLVTTTSVTESITELESTTTVKNNTIENPADLTTTKVTIKPTTQSKGLTNTTANIPDTEPASHDTATTVAESISASIESQHTAANITDITESKSTDLVTTTSVTESITELESTTTVKNNTIENPADLTTTKVTVKPTTQSKGLTNTTANIPDTEPASHDTATTVAESISASIESQHTAANITDITVSKSTGFVTTTTVAESITEPENATTNITDTESTNYVETTIVYKPITESEDTTTIKAYTTEKKSTDVITTAVAESGSAEDVTSFRTDATESKYTDYITTTIAVETSEEYIDTLANMTGTEDVEQYTTAVTSSFEETPLDSTAQSIGTEEACEMVEVEEEIDCCDVDEEDGVEIEEDCEEVQETGDEDCDDSTATTDVTPTSSETVPTLEVKTVVRENYNNDTEETPTYQTGEINTDDIKESEGRATSDDASTKVSDTAPDLWGTYGEVEDVEYIVHSSDKTTTRYSVIDNLLKLNEGHERTTVNRTKENVGVTQERNEKANLENNPSKSVVENLSSFPKLIHLMKENHDPTSNPLVQTNLPLTNHSASKTEKNVSGQDCTLHESHPQLIFINERANSESPSAFRKEESVVALLKKVSTKNKAISEVNKANFEKSERNNQLKYSHASATENRKDSNPEKSDLAKENIPGESKSKVSIEEATDDSKKYQKLATGHVEEMNFADNDYVVETDEKISKQKGLHAVSKPAVVFDNKDSKMSENETSAHKKSLIVIGEEQTGRIYPENHILNSNKQGKELDEEDKPDSKRGDSTDTKLSEQDTVSYQGMINKVYADNFLFRHGKHTSLESNATRASKDVLEKVSDNPDTDNSQENQKTKKQSKSEQHLQKTQLEKEQTSDSNDNLDINPNPEEDNADLNADKDQLKDEDKEDDKDEGEQDRDGEDDESDENEDDEGGESENSEDGDASDENQRPEGDGPNEDRESESSVEESKTKEMQEKSNNNQEDDAVEYEKHGDNDPGSEELNDDRKLSSEEDDPEKEPHKRHGVENDIAERGKIVGDITPKERNASNMTETVNDDESKVKKRRKPPSVLTEFNGHIDSLEKIVYDDDYSHWDDDASVLLNFDDIPSEIIDRVQNSDLTDSIVPMDMQHQDVQGRPMEVVQRKEGRSNSKRQKRRM